MTQALLYNFPWRSFIQMCWGVLEGWNVSSFENILLKLHYRILHPCAETLPHVLSILAVSPSYGNPPNYCSHLESPQFPTASFWRACRAALDRVIKSRNYSPSPCMCGSHLCMSKRISECYPLFWDLPSFFCCLALPLFFVVVVVVIVVETIPSWIPNLDILRINCNVGCKSKSSEPYPKLLFHNGSDLSKDKLSLKEMHGCVKRLLLALIL